MTQNTLHRQSAKFIAAIAENLPLVPRQDMEEFIEKPTLLKKALSGAFSKNGGGILGTLFSKRSFGLSEESIAFLSSLGIETPQDLLHYARAGRPHHERGSEPKFESVKPELDAEIKAFSKKIYNYTVKIEYEEELLQSEDEIIAGACKTIEDGLQMQHGHDIIVYFPDITRSSSNDPTQEAYDIIQDMAKKVKSIFEAKGYTVRTECYVLSDFREVYFYIS